MKNLLVLLLFIHSLLFNVFALGADSRPQSSQEYYNEIYEGEQVRDIYQPLTDYLQAPTREQDQKDFLVQSRKAFRKDNALDAVPRILSPTEAAEIQQGVEQRARALRAFLKDHYSGKRYYATAGVLPAKVVKRIISRIGESAYDGLVNPQTISFMYGPDIIRDSEGNWRVIEDNPGFIGGIGDLKLAYDLMMQKHPSLQQHFEFADPIKFKIREITVS